jgi:hypothetical protein
VSEPTTPEARAALVVELQQLLNYSQTRGKEWSLTKRDDGSACVYVSQIGLMRMVVEIAETTVSDGELICALRNRLPAILAALQAQTCAQCGAKIAEHHDVGSVDDAPNQTSRVEATRHG